MSGTVRRPALMTHVVLGYPTLRESLEIVRVMAASGASIIELQIPFSDPIGDGPTITAANTQALRHGVRPRDCMRAMDQLSGEVNIPLLFMSYLNPLLSYGFGKQPHSRKRRCRGAASTGLKTFFRDAHHAGAQGIIVPDIPPEESHENFWQLARSHQLAAIPLVTPVSDVNRVREIKRVADRRGFIYCVSNTATTGARHSLPPGLGGYLKRMKGAFKMPIAVGFGVSRPAHIKALRGYADIAIVGSATIDLVKNTPSKDRNRALERFIASLTTQ